MMMMMMMIPWCYLLCSDDDGSGEG